MILSNEQKLNLLAIECLEAHGNYAPTEAEIEKVEQLLSRQGRKTPASIARTKYYSPSKAYAN